MSRGKRLSKGERRWRKKQRESEQNKLDTAVNETAMIATCWHKAAVYAVRATRHAWGLAPDGPSAERERAEADGLAAA